MGSVDSDLIRASMLLASDPAAALREAAHLLERSPAHVGATLLLSAAAVRLGDPARAIAALEPAAALHPSSAVIQFELGKAYRAAGRGAEAIAALERAVAADARLAEAWKELATERHRVGDEQGGDRAYAKYCALTPDPPELADARVALADNRLRAAEAMLARRLGAAPRDAVALRMLAEISTRRENLPEAERRLIECLGVAPGYAAARCDLVRVLSAQQRFPEASAQLDRLLAADPGNTSYLTLKTHALRFLGRHREAIVLAEELTKTAPDDSDLWLNVGHLHRGVGNQEAAIQAYRRVLRSGASVGRAYWSLANLKTYRFTDAEIEAMKAHLDPQRVGTSERMGISERVMLEFSLGKALEDENRFEESFAHYARGNALHRASIAYDPDRVDADVARSQAFYDRQFFAHRSGWGTSRADPIFIVGLPRSGSTLLEQMLASHSQVEATHELVDISAIAGELMAAGGADESQAYPRSVGALSRSEVEGYAERYLARTRHYRRLGKDRFIDKMLANFGHTGLIHLLFPNAAIIDIRRHPLASCFSCYRQYFSGSMNFAYDLGELGRYYRAYVRLMDHMESVLPGRVLRVRYEDLVTNTEVELRKVLDYCRLPFEAQCLRYFESGRVVHTISSEQVRRPIYTDSVNEWRNFEPWLGPLKDALGDLVGRDPR